MFDGPAPRLKPGQGTQSGRCPDCERNFLEGERVAANYGAAATAENCGVVSPGAPLKFSNVNHWPPSVVKSALPPMSESRIRTSLPSDRKATSACPLRPHPKP